MRFVPLLCLLACSVPNAEGPRVQRLPADTFLSALAAEPDAYLVDCRTPSEQAAGMLPGAVSMDFRAPGFRDAAERMDPSRPIYVYCAAGGRSARAAQVFDSLGFSKVVDLAGGYRGLKGD